MLRALTQQIAIGIRLNLRNRMALVYGYLFPALFLFAFRVLYRQDRVPLVLHAGELLTVTILGGACFGLPTGIVSDRERGVWRRFRMLPVSPFAILCGTLVTRYILLLTAGLLQLALAMAAGMPAPRNPTGLFLEFSAAAIAFMGIGLDIAMLAPNVAAVQALGQCIFLPMLIIGGVAVPLASLPGWAQHLSAFLPGRYAVEAIQSRVGGPEIGAGSDLLALLAMGASGALAGFLAFRWDSSQKPSPWLVLALGGWLIAGFATENRGRIHTEAVQREEQPRLSEYAAPASSGPAHTAQPDVVPQRSISARPQPEPVPGPSHWEDVKPQDIDGVAFERLPEDTGVIAPIAGPNDEPDPAIADQLERLRTSLPDWAPGKHADPVQRVRNLLYAAGVADVYRMDPLERFVPLVVFEQIQETLPETDLTKVLYFIALHPDEGGDAAVRQLHELGLPDGPQDTRTMRNRSMLYAFKLLGRLTGHLSAK